MKVTIIIPVASLERFSSLLRAIESIQAGTYRNVYIVVIVDGNAWLYMRLKQTSADLGWQNVYIILNEKRMNWVFSQNLALKMFDSEYYVCAADDHIFSSDCIESAVKVMQKHFADGFGVVSLWKRNNAVIALFGRKWADHFSERQVFCPDYVHYGADSVFVATAAELGKLKNLPPGVCGVKHYSPKDETQNFSQLVRKGDAKMRSERDAKGYKWGIDFNLIIRK